MRKMITRDGNSIKLAGSEQYKKAKGHITIWAANEETGRILRNIEPRRFMLSLMLLSGL